MSYRLTAACDTALDDFETVERALGEVVDAAGLHAIASVHHRFEPRGLSVAFILSESHLAIHTWPESGSAYVTLTSCRPSDGAVETIGTVLASAFGAERVTNAVVAL